MMEIHEFSNLLPINWTDESKNGHSEFILTDLTKGAEFTTIHFKLLGLGLGFKVQKIVRIENSYLYGQFLLRKEEYESRGAYQVMELVHDTSQENALSIAQNNFDWRRACRVKFGHGVSFSPSAKYANEKSNFRNGVKRAMIIADVLVGKSYSVTQSCTLPMPNYDTTTGNRGNVYVKFYDNEFYPHYIVYYTKGI